MVDDGDVGDVDDVANDAMMEMNGYGRRVAGLVIWERKT